MIAAWMAYSIVVALLLGLAAAALDRAARLYGWPSRWIWFGVLVGSVVAPVVAWFAGAEPASAGGGEVQVLLGPAVVQLASADAGTTVSLLAALDWLRDRAAGLDAALLAGWIAASLAALIYVGISAGVLIARRRRWWPEVLDGVPVLVSRDTGPAVVGFLRSRIVVPDWALTADETLRRLMLTHEREHVRAGDPALLLAGIVALILMPWNGALWWQLRRLRLAVEMDCDARVLRRYPDVRRYGTLLLEVGRRSQGYRLPVTAFSEPRSFLARRIRRMTEPGRPRRVLWAVASLAAGATVIVLACQTPIPDRIVGSGSDAVIEEKVEVEVLPQGDIARLMDGPVFTPYTQAPELRNREAVTRTLQASYPPLLRDAGIGGRALVWFLIDQTGKVVKTQLRESSGHEALDQAALHVARTMEFEPARNRGEPVAVWVALPITFNVDGLDTRPSRESAVVRELPALPPPRPDRVGDEPAFTPYAQAPELRNREEVMRALQEHYPALLRDAGIGGRVVVWFFIDKTGKVIDTRLRESSGHEELDEAALQVARLMEFEPAKNRGEPVGIWIALPVTFGVK